MMRATVLAVLVLAAIGCGHPTPLERGAIGTCTRLRSERSVRGTSLCEDVWTCVRPPGGAVDRVGLRRFATCEAAAGPVVLYLPGMHMNGESPFTAAGNDVRLYLAAAGFRVWAIDYRTHAVEADAPPDQLATLATWTADTFAADVVWGLGFVSGAEQGTTPYLMGFSYGAGLAYRVASRKDVDLAGLVILDGMSSGAVSTGDAPGTVDVGSSRLPYVDRQRLLSAARRDPDSPSPIPGYRTSGEALSDILYTAQSFGGQGGLSNAKNGVTDVQVLATLLAGYDRWWPRAAMGTGAAEPSRTLPVLAFANGQMGEAWASRVRATAERFGGAQATVQVLAKHGHLDVLVGQQAVQNVFEPARKWMLNPAGGLPAR